MHVYKLSFCFIVCVLFLFCFLLFFFLFFVFLSFGFFFVFCCFLFFCLLFFCFLLFFFQNFDFENLFKSLKFGYKYFSPTFKNYWFSSSWSSFPPRPSPRRKYFLCIIKCRFTSLLPYITFLE